MARSSRRGIAAPYGWRVFVLRACLVLILAVAGRGETAEPVSAVGALLKLYQSGRLPAERQPTVVEMICTRGNAHDLRVVLDRLLEPDGMTLDLKRQTLDWLLDAAETRKVQPAGDVSRVAELIATEDAGVQAAAVRLAAAWRIDSVIPLLVQVARDPAAAPTRQQEAIHGLAAYGAKSRAILNDLAATGSTIGLRTRAVAALAAVDLAAAADQAAHIFAAAEARDDLSPMLDAIWERKQGSELLARSLRGKALSVDVAKRALRYMYSIGRSDAALSELLSKAAGVAVDPPPPTQEEVARLVREVLAQGDAARGEQIFRREDLSCLRCHSLNRAGGQIGPELSAVGVSSPVDYIVNSILNPNLAIKEQYVTRVLVTSDGRALTGIIIDRDESRVRLRDSQGKTHVVATAEIEEELEGQTLMPQGLTKFLTHGELLDLIRFISELGKAGPYGVRTASLIQRWQILSAPAPELIEAPPHLEHVRLHVLGAPSESWRNVFGLFSGELPLEELRAEVKPTVVVLRGEVQVTESGSLGMRIRCTEPYQAWVDATPCEAQTEIVTALEAGRHQVTVRVEISDRAAPRLQVEFYRPEGSPVQWEVVGGS